MVSIKAVQAANDGMPSKAITAVFIGATSGIGLGAIQALLPKATASKIYIVGRSQSKFAPTLAKLQAVNKAAKIIFIEAQVSLLKEVKRVCQTVKDQESAIDLLWLSQGGLDFTAHHLSPEGIESNSTTKYYSRILFMHEFMPLLNKSSDPRVVSILSAGQEGDINMTDIGISNPENYKFFPSMKQNVSMLSLTMRYMSLENPKISFIHTNPGMVSTKVHSDWANTMTGLYRPLGWLLKLVLIPLMHSFGWTPEEAGQIGLYEATDQRYSASSGQNFFRLSENGEYAGDSKILSQYEEDGTQEKIWEHTLEVFDRVV